MVSVEFLSDDIIVEVPEGSKMVDVARQNGASVPFGCANGVCGTCISKIVSGNENLSQPGPREQQTLEMFGADGGEHRLLCQCIVNGDVKVDNP